VNYIIEEAFRDCTHLNSITLPFIGSKKDTTIDETAVFGSIFGYTSTSSSTPPSGATYQYDKGSGANRYYHYYIPASLSTVVITGGNNIPNRAFYNCYGLASITIPNSVTSIGDHAFWDCFALTSITIPNSVTSIGDFAFLTCIGLTSVTFQGTISSSGFNNSAFGGDLCSKFYATNATNGTPGTYLRASGSMSDSIWNKQ